MTRFSQGIFLVVVTVALIVRTGPSLRAQEIIDTEDAQTTVNYNEIYKFPASVGFKYEYHTPILQYNLDENDDIEFQGHGITATVVVPIPPVPILQPFVELGVIQVNTQDNNANVEGITDPDEIDRRKTKYNQTHLTGGLGLALFYKFSKNIEIGAEIDAGFAYTLLPNYASDGEMRSSVQFLASVGAGFQFSPFYNLTIGVAPRLRFIKAINPLDNLDGLHFGIGVTAQYRFGVDPDSPKAAVRSIKFTNAEVEPIFAAMQSYYVDHPIGGVTITNIEDFPVEEAEVSFFQNGFMDTPTVAATIPELAPGESTHIDLFATFNQEVFSTEGITPLTGEISVKYSARGQAAEQTYSVTYDMHDKTALTWDDESKVGAFVTSADSALRNYSSYIRQSTKDSVIPGLSEALQIGMQVYHALGEIGCLYQRDPTTPFDAAQENPLIVDSVSLPRQTLSRLTGDCDDLTVLFCSLLETVGIQTGYITVPGHIYAAFNTRMLADDYAKVHPDKRMTMDIDGELWVPVEITMIGLKSFLEAWRAGIEEWRAYNEAEEHRRLTVTTKAQERFRPVVLKERDLGLQYGSRPALVERFDADIAKLVDTIIEDYTLAAQEKARKNDYNRLGIICAQYGRYIQAEDAFNAALALDRNYLSPKINLGNLYYLQKEHHQALRQYHGAEQVLLDAGRDESAIMATIMLNLSKAYYELENFARATDYYNRVKEMNPDLVRDYSYLASDNDKTRAADVANMNQIIYVDEEE
jgi:tetratricopeptide (TPR) repeat protein